MTSTGLDIAVVGSGICGMCTAMTLAERGHTVTLYERDGPPPEGNADAAFFDWNRRGAGDLGYLKFGVFPGDNGSFAIILCLPVGEGALQNAVRDPIQFDQICLSIPGLEPWLASGRASATTDPFGDALSAAAWKDITVLRGIMRTVHLLEKPGDFLKEPALRRRVFLYMFRERRRNAASRLQPGPDRESMHRLLGMDPVMSACSPPGVLNH